MKDAAATTQSIATILGIAAAAWWWFVRRPSYPRADLSLSVLHRRLDEDTIWLRVRAVLSNKGQALIVLTGVQVYVQRVLPLHPDIATALTKKERILAPDKAEIAWHEIGQSTILKGACEIEPGESDNLAWDFPISSEHRVVLVYVHLDNEAKRNRGPIGWSDSVVYDIAEPVEQPVNPSKTEVVHPQLPATSPHTGSNTPMNDHRDNVPKTPATTEEPKRERTPVVDKLIIEQTPGLDGLIIEQKMKKDAPPSGEPERKLPDYIQRQKEKKDPPPVNKPSTPSRPAKDG